MRAEESYIGSEIDAWRGTLLLFEQNVGDINAISFAAREQKDRVIKSSLYFIWGNRGSKGRMGGIYKRDRERTGGRERVVIQYPPFSLPRAHPHTPLDSLSAT